MYSSVVTSLQLRKAQETIDKRPKRTERFNLQRVTADDLHKPGGYIEHFNSLLNAEGQIDAAKRPQGLLRDEREFIESQRILCKLDYLYFISHYWFIASTLGGTGETTMLLAPNVPQRVDISIWAEHEEKFWPIQMLELKARQLGKTELYQSAIGHRVLFYQGTNALIGSSDPEKSRLMANQKIGRGIAGLPYWLRPQCNPADQPRQTGEIYWEFPELDSRIIIQHGTQRSGLARGSTIQCYHLSEPAEYNKPEELIDASLKYTVHDDPMTFGCIEGTAKGDTGWLSTSWEVAKRLWPEGISQFRPNFTPWYTGTTIYPMPTWSHQHRPKPGWKPDELTTGHARKAAEYVAANEPLQRVLGKGWMMPLNQQWFWEASRREAEAKDQVEKFMEEMPSNDLEAFQSVGYSIFTPQVLMRVGNTQKPLALYQGKPAVFAIVGSEIPAEFAPTPSQIDTSRQNVHIVSNLAFGLPPFRFRLVPLKFEGFDRKEHELDRLYIWEWPSPRWDYGFGIDLGDGIGKDRSVAEVLRKGTPGRPCEQVAEFASSRVSLAEFAPFALALGAFFSCKPGPAAFNQPLMVVELNRAGYVVQDQLRKWGWSNFPDWEGAKDQRVAHVRNRMGWVTTGWNRDEIISVPAKYIKSGDLVVNSPYYLSEMKTLKRPEGSAKVQASAGHYDDRYFALGIGFIKLHDADMLFRNQPSTVERTEQAEAAHVAAMSELYKPDTTSWMRIPHQNDSQTDGPLGLYVPDGAGDWVRR